MYLKYGCDKKELSFPDKAKVTVLGPASLPVIENLSQTLAQTLTTALGEVAFNKRPAPQSAAIAVPDESRPVPLKEILPILIDGLRARFPSLEPGNITIVIGGGLHPPLERSSAEQWIPPEISRGCRLVVHSALESPLKDFGQTRRGTPVIINAEYAKADLKLVVGLIDPHQFVGFTGGAKGVVIGCSAPPTIEHNHGLMFEDGAEVGRLQGNPVREDLNEAGRMVGVDLAVNLVLDAEHRPVGLWAGEPTAVLEAGAAVCAKVYGVALEKKFDIAVASCGGRPKDICLYQAQKGLNLASHAVKPDGKILLLAACEQGVGDGVYFEYVSRFETAEAAYEDFKKTGFKMGAHKSYLFGRTLMNYEVAIESNLDKEMLGRCHLTAGPAQETLNRWVDEFPGRPRVAVIPNANTTYFYPA